MSGKKKKGTAKPVKFAPEEESFIDQAQEQTGLNQSEVIRRAVAYALPKFLSGEVNILTLAMPAAAHGAKA